MAVNLILLLSVLCSCSKDIGETRCEFTALDTYVTLTAYGNRNCKDILKDTIEKYDNLFSVTNLQSEIYKLNYNKKLNLSEETLELISKSIEYSEKTNGLFDITVYPILKEWGFTTKSYNVPDKEVIESLLKNVSYENIMIKDSLAKLEHNSEIDLGGIAKGYIGDKCEAVLKRQGVTGGILSLGGNINAFGEKPGAEYWSVGVEYPNSTNYFGIIKVKDKNIISSGAYQRNFKIGNNLYHHIIDPKTGHPADSDLKLTTVIDDDGAFADAMSTALFVMGYNKAKEFSIKNNLSVILLNENDQLWISENIRDDFTLQTQFKNIINIDY